MKKSLLILFSLFFGLSVFAQQFEQEKINPDNFKDVRVYMGADFALQYQAISHSASIPLLDIKNNFNLPTANLSVNADLAPGISVHINNFMSSRHHNEAWVEGGYMVIDYLPFLPAAKDIMKYITIKAGVFNPNYGDAHFYRSTNGAVTTNPFVGNWIMDAYTTNPGMEIMYRNNGIIAMVGTNNGRMNYGRGNDLGKDLVFNWKLGYDTQVNEDLRLRATLSGYHVPKGHSGSYLWGGDRAGARYYNVMQAADADDNFRSGRWDPSSGQTEMTSLMANVFVKFHGLEVFGIYENMNGVRRELDQHFTQTAVQAIYRTGSFYFGTRYNRVSDNEGSTVVRTNFGGGWNMLSSVLVKLDYVNQQYDGAAHGDLDGGEFKGLVIEAAISF
ncbi:MAG: hypothetical protein JW857_07810 [Bacteroidales bacterium]|nr:hypothetical protein [Bacteroidales bacterium]